MSCRRLPSRVGAGGLVCVGRGAKPAVRSWHGACSAAGVPLTLRSAMMTTALVAVAPSCDEAPASVSAVATGRIVSEESTSSDALQVLGEVVIEVQGAVDTSVALDGIGAIDAGEVQLEVLDEGVWPVRLEAGQKATRTIRFRATAPTQACAALSPAIDLGVGLLTPEGTRFVEVPMFLTPPVDLELPVAWEMSLGALVDFAPAPDGGAWVLADDRVTHVDPSGAIRPIDAGFAVQAFAVDPDSGEVALAGRGTDASELRIDLREPDGSLEWSHLTLLDAPPELAPIISVSQGTVLTSVDNVFGAPPPGGANIVLEAHGGAFVALSQPMATRARPAPGGGFVVLANGLRRIDGQGTMGDPFFSEPVGDFAIAEDGSIAALVRRAQLEMVTLDPSGAAGPTTTLWPASERCSAATVAWLDNGEVLVADGPSADLEHGRASRITRAGEVSYHVTELSFSVHELGRAVLEAQVIAIPRSYPSDVLLARLAP